MPARILGFVSMLLASIGLFISATLSLSHLKGAVVPCGGGSGCAVVGNSAYSYWFGLPVSYYGAAGYVALLLVSVASLAGDERRRLLGFGLLLAGVGTVASAALIAVATFLIKAECLWCIASATTMAFLLITYALRWRFGPGSIAWQVGAAAGLVMACAAVYGAIAVEERSARDYVNRQAVRAASLAELAGSAPSKGPTDAPVVLVEFSDFACPACRDVYGRVENLLSHSGSTVRLVYRHLPQSVIPGHEASHHGAEDSVLAARAGKFWQFADRAFAIPEPPRPEDYDRVLRSLGVPGAADSETARIVDADIALARRLGIHLTPVFIIFSPESPPAACTNVDLLRTLEDPLILKYLQPGR